MRKPFIAGNWKLNKTNAEAVTLVTELKRELSEVDSVEMAVCPIYIALPDVIDALKESNIGVGAQNIYWEDSGAFTGEVSGPVLKNIGVQYVIIGHSERRQYFGETDETVNKRLGAALKHGLVPIVCVGETLEEREADKTFDVIKTQIKGALNGYGSEDLSTLVIAYEPVWAIGTGKTATPDQAQEVHQFIRGLITELYDESFAQSVRIQYGGSVKPENITELISQADIDGALVGGASLKTESFAGIIKGCQGVTK